MGKRKRQRTRALMYLNRCFGTPSSRSMPSKSSSSKPSSSSSSSSEAAPRALGSLAYCVRKVEILAGGSKRGRSERFRSGFVLQQERRAGGEPIRTLLACIVDTGVEDGKRRLSVERACLHYGRREGLAAELEGRGKGRRRADGARARASSRRALPGSSTSTLEGCWSGPM